MYRRVFKPLFDFLAALLLFPPFLVIYGIIGICIKLDDGGSIIYQAKRLGKDGHPFTMLKFRTMKENAPDLRNSDGTTYNAQDDIRLTAIGKTLRKLSLDELPQIVNVLKGEMSFIGPRPDLLDQIDIYQGNEIRKLECKPGITGYNQSYFRNSIPVRERFVHDIFYVDHISFLFDCKILAKTAVTVLRREKVYTSQS